MAEPLGLQQEWFLYIFLSNLKGELVSFAAFFVITSQHYNVKHKDNWRLIIFFICFFGL